METLEFEREEEFLEEEVLEPLELQHEDPLEIDHLILKEDFGFGFGSDFDVTSFHHESIESETDSETSLPSLTSDNPVSFAHGNESQEMQDSESEENLFYASEP